MKMNIVELLQSGYGSGLARLARASLKMDPSDEDASAAVRLALEELFKRDASTEGKRIAAAASQLRSVPPRKRPVGVEMLVDLLHAGCLVRMNERDAACAIVEGWHELLRPILVEHSERARVLDCTGVLEDRAHAALLREEAFELEASFDVITADLLHNRSGAQATPSQKAPATATWTSPKRGLVLIVDDDDDVREALGILLEGNGYDVVGAENGARAIDILEKGVNPNVIILDLMMPVMSGWDFHKWQMRQPKTAPPTIVFTAAGLTPGSLGDLKVLSKNVDPAVLLAELQQAVTPIAA